MEPLKSMEIKKFDQLAGPRIVLKALNSQSFSDDYAIWMQDKDILQSISRKSKIYTKADLTAYIAQMNESLSDYLFGIFLKEKDLHIGNIKIGNVDHKRKKADVGLLIGNKAMWGNGYATEAIGLVTDYAFNQLDLNKLIAGMFIDNVGSIKAFSKLGYKQILSSKTSDSVGKAVDIILLEKVKEKS
jgi:ribosomal-protein-alanine N-acetyltransferase